jgi:NADPH:quinone reductase-like Zn-dependent oxidoreductase
VKNNDRQSRALEEDIHMKAIVVSTHGGPEVLEWRDHEVGNPGPGEVRIRQEAVGLNFIDVYFRTGLYPAPQGLPLVPGNEAAGVVQPLVKVSAFSRRATGLPMQDRSVPMRRNG